MGFTILIIVSVVAVVVFVGRLIWQNMDGRQAPDNKTYPDTQTQFTNLNMPYWGSTSGDYKTEPNDCSTHSYSDNSSGCSDSGGGGSTHSGSDSGGGGAD